MKIAKYKKERDKYILYLDNGEMIKTYEDIILKYNLLFNKDIDGNFLDKIEKENLYYEVYHNLQKMIGRKLRSEKWVRDYLKSIKDFNEKMKKELISSLKVGGFINDERYALAYTNDKINLSLDGPNKIIKDLHKENIDNKTVEDVMKIFTPDILEERISKIINKKCRENKRYTGFVLKTRISNYLMKMGYSLDDINAYEHLITFDSSIISKEFEKMYKKYSKKLKGDELFKKIRQSLYTCGISGDEINALIDEKRLEEESKNC